MKSEVRITTPEQVLLQMQLAGIGSRGIAQLVDMGVLSIVYALMATGIFLWHRYHAFGIATSYIIGFSGLMGFLIFWGYFIAFETLWSGKTFGKWMVKIRTISDDGRPVSVFAATVRNLLRIVDYFPGGYVVGLVSMMVDPKERRVGDIAAGTLVVVDHAPSSLLTYMPTNTRNSKVSSVSIPMEERQLVISLKKSMLQLRITGDLPLEWQTLLSHLDNRLRGMSRVSQAQTAERVWREFMKLPAVTVETIQTVSATTGDSSKAAEVLGVGEVKTTDVLRIFHELSRLYRKRSPHQYP